MIRNTLFTTAAVIALGLSAPAIAADMDDSQARDLRNDGEIDSGSNSGSTSLTGQLPNDTTAADDEMDGDVTVGTDRDTVGDDRDLTDSQARDLRNDGEIDSGSNSGSTSLTGQLPQDDGTFGSESELEGMKYSDVQGRSVYSTDNTEIGTVERVHVDQAGNPDGLIVRGTGDFERADARIFMPIAGVRQGQGDDVDLQADVSDEELTSIMNKQAAGTGRGTLDKDLGDQ